MGLSFDVDEMRTKRKISTESSKQVESDGGPATSHEISAVLNILSPRGALPEMESIPESEQSTLCHVGVKTKVSLAIEAVVPALSRMQSIGLIGAGKMAQAIANGIVGVSKGSVRFFIR